MSNRSTERDRRGSRPEHEIVLVCNPQAGGRWRALARILDSKEAKHVRRIVTDSISDIGPAIRGLGRSARLICIYGGDGTIQRLLDRMLLGAKYRTPPQIAFVGGGTMNVTATWCGFNRDPGRNFRQIVNGYRSGELLFKEVPLLRVSHGETEHLGFTFGMGVPIRLLDVYEQGTKGKGAAVKTAVDALLTVWTGFPRRLRGSLDDMPATISIDDASLPYERYATLFCNVTGQINPGITPFAQQRTRDTFHYAAYAASTRELSLMLPLLARGVRPIDAKSLMEPVSIWRQMIMSLQGKGSVPADDRYRNGLARTVDIHTAEPLYTVDGELFSSGDEPLRVEIGPTLRLAVKPRTG